MGLRACSLVVGTIAAVAWGQCEPGWTDDFRGAFFYGGEEASATVFNDGSGPKLVVAGLGRRGEAEQGLQVWDGQSWSTLALPQGALGNEGIVRAFNDHDPPRLVFAENRGSQYQGAAYLLQNGVWETMGFPAGLQSQFLGVAPGVDPSSDDVYVCGSFEGSEGRTLVYHWDGQEWTKLDEHSNSSVSSIAWFDDGSGPKLYASALGTIDGVLVRGVARWDGLAWEKVGDGGPSSSPRIMTHDDGTGLTLWAIHARAAELARWDGLSWTSYPLASGGNTQARVFASLELGGRQELLWIEGFSYNYGNRLWRWDGLEGELVTETTAGGAWDLAQDPTGLLGSGLLVAGDFLHAGEVDASGVARWDGEAWHALGTEDIGNGARYADAVIALGEDAGQALGRRVYVSADIVGGENAHEVAAWDGRRWEPIGPSDMPRLVVDTFAVGDLGDGTRLFAAGSIIHSPDTGYAVIAWDGHDWSVAGDQMSGYSVYCLAFGQLAGGEPTLYVAGNFTEADGEANSGVVGLTIDGWVSLDGGLPDIDGRPGIYAIAVHDDGSGAALYSGVPHDAVNTYFRNAVVRWNGQYWQRVGGSLGDSNYGAVVYSLLSADLGDGAKLYAGGSIHMFDNVAVWDGEQWLPLGDGLPFSVSSLAKIDTPDGPRLVATSGTYTGGELAERVWIWDGSTWSPFGTVADERVRGVVQAEHENGSIYLAGDFNQIAGVSSEGVARYGCNCPADFNADGTLDTRDFVAFLNAWAAGDNAADFDGNGVLDTRDFIAYLGAWAAGC